MGPQLAQLVLSSSFSYLFTTLFLLPLGTRTDPGGGLEGARPRGSKYFIYIYIYNYNIFHLCNWAPSKTLGALSPQ